MQSSQPEPDKIITGTIRAEHIKASSIVIGPGHPYVLPEEVVYHPLDVEGSDNTYTPHGHEGSEIDE